MAEFNLIPDEYFQAARQRRRLLLGVGMTVAVLLTCGVLVGSSLYLLGQREADLAVLRQQKALTVQQQERFAYLQQQKLQLESELRLLTSLQSGAPIAQILSGVEDAARPTGVRFESWAFRRAGIRTAEDPEVRPPGFFSLGPDSQFPASWQSLTQMTIHGEAKDHAALSTFVQRLFRQKDIEDVRIQRSAQSDRGVEFQLAVVLVTQAGEA